MTTNLTTSGPLAEGGLTGRVPGEGDCWNHIGVSGDRTCPELNTFIHCRNCPVFAAAARTFFDRPAPEGYLADWARWLAASEGREARGAGNDQDQDSIVSNGDGISVLIFRLGEEWLAFRTDTVAQVTTPR